MSLPRLMALPQRFMIQAAPKTDLDVNVRLNWDGEAAKILEATSSDAETSVKVNEEDNRQIVVLHVPAGYDPANKMGHSVTIRTDDPIVPVMQIPIMVVANQPARPNTPTGRVVPMRTSAQTTVTTRPAGPVPEQSSELPK